MSERFGKLKRAGKLTLATEKELKALPEKTANSRRR